MEDGATQTSTMQTASPSAAGRGTRRLELPATAAARQHVAEGQSFSLDLAVGQYVLVAPVGGSGDLSFVDVTVTAGQVLHQDLPNLCK
jgi:hypothetical protein